MHSTSRATYDTNHWLIAFIRSKNKLPMWNNNTVEVYKALILLADSMRCWFRTSDCFPYDPCHSFPLLLASELLLGLRQNCFNERMKEISSKSNLKNFLLGIWKSLYYVQTLFNILIKKFFFAGVSKEGYVSSCFLKHSRF